MNNTIRIVVVELVILCIFIVIVNLFLSSRWILRHRRITTALSCDFWYFPIGSQSPVFIYGENVCRYHVDVYRQIILPQNLTFYYLHYVDEKESQLHRLLEFDDGTVGWSGWWW